MSYYTLEFDFTVSTQGVKSYVESTTDEEVANMHTNGHIICLNCVIYNCVKDRTLQICIGTHNFLVNLGIIDDSNAINDTVMEYITKELALLDIYFNPNEHYFSDTIEIPNDENDVHSVAVHSVRIPYNGVGFNDCDTLVDAYNRISSSLLM